jgi:serine/threonine protein kinase/tetratricopeptide (TPR) repeat protein
MTNPPDREVAVFNAARRLPAGERSAYLAEACAGDAALHQRIEELLQASDEAGNFLESLSAVAVIPAEKAGNKIGRYKLLQQIGEGGCGVVYMAEQEEPVRRRVALKVIKLGMDTKSVIARFEAERQALALMDHPNIAKVLDAGATETGRPYFVMELVRGIKITDYCDQNNLSTRERLDLFMQVCRAIQHAHQKGIIHRDIKPSNILVTMDDRAPVPKVIDFGIAKATQGKLSEHTLFTAFEQFVGTPAYMSPEQAEMRMLDIDTRSDIYSLGVLLYELLTGQTPFDAKKLLQAGLDEIRRTIREQEPARPSTCLSTMLGADLTLIAQHRQTEPPKLIHLVRGDLDWIVMKALEKDRTRRYETANGLAMDIQRHMENEPVQARPPSAGYRLQKTWQRNKTAFAVATLIAAVLVAATGISAWQAVRARHAETLAQQRLIQSEANATLANERLVESDNMSILLTDIFLSPDPGRDGRTITVAETLAAAVKKLDIDLTNQPARRAKLQSAIGITYFRLGLLAEALPLQEKARDYYLAANGLENDDTLDAMNNLANSYDGLGGQEQRMKALKLREQVYALELKVNGPEHTNTLKAMVNVALSYDTAGRGDDAIKLSKQVLEIRRKVSSPEDPDTLRSIYNLAYAYEAMGHWEDALNMQEPALPLFRKVLGPGDPTTLAGMQIVARCYDALGHPDKDLELSEQILELYKKGYGPSHSYTLTAMNHLANCYERAGGRSDDALKLREESMKLSREAHGPESLEASAAMNNLAISYAGLGRRDDALKLREQVLAVDRKVQGPEHEDTIKAMGNLALSYDDFGSNEVALNLREQVLPLARKVLGPEVLYTFNAMVNLANNNYRARRWEDANKLLEEALPLSRKLKGPKHSDTLFILKLLADSYTEAGRGKEAAPLLENLWEADPQDTDSSLTLATLQTWFGQDADYEATRHRLVQQAVGTDQAGTAERAAKAATIRPGADSALLTNALNLAQRAVELGKDSSSLPWYQLGLGMAEYRAGQYSAAEQPLTTAEQTAGGNDDLSGIARVFHAMTLFRLNRGEEARKLVREAESQMPPWPKNDSKPVVDGKFFDHDVLIMWLAYREARALIEAQPATSSK